MTITTKFSPGDTVWFIHPLSMAINSSIVDSIEINIDSFGTITVLNIITVANLTFRVDDQLTFATQADLVAAYAAVVSASGTGVLTLTGQAPTADVAPTP